MNLVNFLDIIYSLFPFLASSNTFNNGNCHPEQQLHQSVGLMTIDSAGVTWTPSTHTQSRGTPACLSFFTIFWVPIPPPLLIQEGDGCNITQSTTMQLRSHSLPAICDDLNVPVCFNLKCFKSKWFIFELVSEKKNPLVSKFWIKAFDQHLYSPAADINIPVLKIIKTTAILATWFPNCFIIPLKS